MKTEKQVRTWWLDDTQERLDKGKTIVFEGHTTEPKEWEETEISFKVIAHEDHLAIVAKYEERIKKLREALNHISKPKHWPVETFVPEVRDRVLIARQALAEDEK